MSTATTAVRSSRSVAMTYRFSPAVLLACFALASVFSSGKWALPAAAWLAPLLGLRFMRTSKAGWGFLSLFIAGAAGQLVAWYGAIPFPTPMFIVTILVGTLLSTVVYLIDRAACPRIARNGDQLFISTLVFPFAGTALELVALNNPTIGSFASAGYAHYGFSAFTQAASVAGITGLVFLVLWTASVMNWAWERGFERASVGRGLAIWALVMVLTLGSGAARLAIAEDSEKTVPVASFTAHEVHAGELMALRERDLEAFRSETRAIHAKYLAQTRVLAEQGARIVTWPELSGIGESPDVETLLSEASDLARETGIYLAVPVFEVPTGSKRPAENRIHVFDATGAQVIKHVKFGGNALEGTLAGAQKLQVVDTPYGRLSAAICWDADYPAVIAQAGRENVDILISPALEYREIDPLHAHIAAFRAIENGVSVIRQTDQGLSMVADPYGRIIASADHFTSAERVVRADVRTNGIATFYPHLGDLTGLISVLGLALVSIWAVSSKVAEIIATKRTGRSS